MEKRTKKMSNVNSEYDSDTEPPNEEWPIWRMDPQASLSDWTIEITVNEGNELDEPAPSTTYHVHKQSLAVGPYKSEYFSRLFQDNGRFAESNECTSKISLHPLQAECFDALLDYLYIGKLNITTQTATALYTMATYFDIQRLRWEAKRFCQKDISENGGTAWYLYYEHSGYLNDDKILTAATNAFCTNFMTLDASTSRLVTNLFEPKIWIAMLQKRPEHASSEENFSLRMSEMIAAFTQNHNDKIEPEIFHQLTRKELLPYIHHGAAMDLIDSERRIVGHEQQQKQDELSELQKRCIRSLSTNWDKLNADIKVHLITKAKNQSPFVLAEILGSTLSSAQQSYQEQFSLLNERIRKLEEEEEFDYAGGIDY